MYVVVIIIVLVAWRKPKDIGGTERERHNERKLHLFSQNRCLITAAYIAIIKRFYSNSWSGLDSGGDKDTYQSHVQVPVPCEDDYNT